MYVSISAPSQGIPAVLTIAILLLTGDRTIASSLVTLAADPTKDVDKLADQGVLLPIRDDEIQGKASSARERARHSRWAPVRGRDQTLRSSPIHLRRYWSYLKACRVSVYQPVAPHDHHAARERARTTSKRTRAPESRLFLSIR